jgi:prepilin-type N-terminal cleavage/methylation domain-containing protein
MARRGFTLIELLVVICILSILITLSVVATVAVLERNKAHNTEQMLATIQNAVTNYATKFGDYPPTSIADIGGRPPNDLNNGVETLVACLSTRKGGPFLQNDGWLGNIDHDSVDRNLTDWYFGNNELREYLDFYGQPIIYFHSKDYAKPRKDMIRYKFREDGAELEVAPELHPVSKTWAGAGRFQLRSVGKDGKPGTADDNQPE